MIKSPIQKGDLQKALLQRLALGQTGEEVVTSLMRMLNSALELSEETNRKIEELKTILRPTDEELLALIKPLVSDERLIALVMPLIPEPIPGTDGIDGLNGETITGPRGAKGETVVGPAGKDGEQGLTPTKKELLRLIKLVVPKTKGPLVVEKDIDYEILLEALRGKLSPEHVLGLEQYVTALFSQIRPSMGYVHGGGDTLEIGAGLSGTRIAGGKLHLSALAAGVLFETPVGTIDGINTTFTVTNTPKAVVLNGSWLFENDGYTLSGLTITMLIVPQSGSTLRSAY